MKQFTFTFAFLLLSLFSFSQTTAYAVNSSTQGVCTVDVSTGTISAISSGQGVNVLAADIDENNNYYGIIWSNGELVQINKVDGTYTNIGGGVSDVLGFACDQSLGISYIINTSGDIYSINLTDGTTTLVKTASGIAGASSLASDNNGILYAITLSDKLYSYNIASETTTFIGDLGVDVSSITGMDFNNSGVLYATIKVGTDNNLYTINTTTGVENFVSSTTDRLAGLSFDAPIVNTVTFNVTDGTNPIENANININSTDIQTNASGVATINLADGNYPYTVSATGFVTQNSSVIVNGSNENVAITLQETEYTVTFNVTDGTNPINNANININSTDIQTNASGIATIELSNDTYNYTVSATGFDSQNSSVIVNGSNENVAITLQETEYIVTFTVTDGTNPLENAVVSINGTNVNTNAIGKAIFNLNDGNYPYTVNLSGYDTFSSNVTVNGGNENISVVLQANVSVSDLEKNISIYPNPTTGQFTIDLRGSARPRSVEITDITGKIIYNTTMEHVALQIDISENASGIYFIKFQNNETVKILKVIKE